MATTFWVIVVLVALLAIAYGAYRFLRYTALGS